MSVRVLIVDDHAGFRREARATLEAAGWLVVGEAGTVATAVAEAAVLRPDVVVLDIGLPDGSGIDAAQEIARASPGCRIVLVSVRPAADYGERLRSSHVAGFLSKTELTPATLSRIVAEPANP
jgi:DNA-binding NarL/FixJ family response regulator